MIAALQLGLSLAVFVVCFCRLVKTDAHTVDAVVLAFWFMGMAALLLAGAPFLPLLLPAECPWTVGTTPVWVYLIFTASTLGVISTTAVHWRLGVPTIFVKEKEL